MYNGRSVGRVEILIIDEPLIFLMYHRNKGIFSRLVDPEDVFELSAQLPLSPPQALTTHRSSRLKMIDLIQNSI